MNETNVKKLIVWLGREGAIAGLEKSALTISELHEIAVQRGAGAEKKARRSDIIIEIVNRDTIRINKSTDDLLMMKQSELIEYFKARKVSKTEILSLLSQLGIRPRYEDSLNLVEFAAREISEFGMYTRVARGT